MSQAYNLAILDLPNPTFIRIGGGTTGQVLTSTGAANGTVIWQTAVGGGGGAVVVDGTSIVGDGSAASPLSVGIVAGGTYVRGANR